VWSASACTMSRSRLTCLSWNIAAVNNNPFEYFIHYPLSNEYDELMQAVEGFVDNPGAADVPVSEVFTNEMFAELKALMTAEGWSGIEETEKYWLDSIQGRKIMSEFIKDKSLGSKRLASMPDRVTNTINTLDKGTLNRPTVISCALADMTQMASWWAAWKTFMFDTSVQVTGKGGKVSTTKPCGLLPKIKKDKYPAVSEAEEAISIPLQALCIGVFDAILVHMLNTLSPTGGWQRLKQEIIANIYANKGARILEIIDTTYSGTDVCFLQEVATEMKTFIEGSRLAPTYHVCAPSMPSAADQNSMVLLRKAAFDVASIEDLTAAAYSSLEKKGSLSDGDLIVIAVRDTAGAGYVFASFHGDTDGLQTAAALGAAQVAAAAKEGYTFVFGLDANCYETPNAGKQLGAAEFGAAIGAAGLTSCWGDVPPVDNYTTFNARTFLQPQLQKASKFKEKAKKGDVNPKDYILWPKGVLTLESASKDNTGSQVYKEGEVFPSLSFPSDHSLIACSLAAPGTSKFSRLLFDSSPTTLAFAAVAVAAAAVAVAYLVHKT